MKTRFLIPLFFLFIFSFALPPSMVFAQETTGGGIETTGQIIGAVLKGDLPLAMVVPLLAQGAQMKGKDYILNKGASIALSTVVMVVGALAWIISFITAFLVGIASLFLNLSVELSTRGFSQMMSAGVGTSIRNSWIIFRDLANIGLVFILLYIAILTIVQAGSFQTKKLLGTTIIVAIAINFSYLTASIVIDVANIIAINIHESIETTIKKSGSEDATLASFIMEKSKTETVSEKIIAATGIPTDKSTENINQIEKSNNESSSPIRWAVGYIMMVILHLVIIVVFMTAAIMLITRIIILMFVLVLSPIGFVSSILPATKKMSNQWWDALIKNAFFLPAFLLFVLVAVKIIEGGGLSVLEEIGNSQKINDDGGLLSLMQKIIGPFVQFSIVIGLFIASLVASKQMTSGGVGGSIGGKITGAISGGAKVATGYAARGAIATGAFAGRQTAGKFAQRYSSTDGFKDFVAKTPGGQYIDRGFKRVAGSSFDTRNTKAGSWVSNATGLTNTVGKGQATGGYQKQFNDRKNKIIKEGEALGNPDLNEDEQKQVLQHETNAAQLRKDAKQAAESGDIDLAQTLSDSAKTASKQALDIQNKRTKQFAENLAKASKASGGAFGGASAAAAEALVKKYTSSADKRALNDLKSVLKEANKQT